MAPSEHNAVTLYGFIDDVERTLFQRLLTASGVGGKLALALMSAYRADRLARAIVEKDLAALQQVSGVGRKLGQRPEITHCYRRPRAPGWPYNVFAMVHGMSREEVYAKISAISREVGLEGYDHDVLFSTRLLKKQGTRVRGAS